MKPFILTPVLVLASCVGVAQRNVEPSSVSPLPSTARLPSIGPTVAGSTRHEGLLTCHIDRERGKLWLELPPPGPRGEVGRFLYIEGLTTGLGSNPVGLDRGQIGPTRLVVLRRLGRRVIVEQPNLRYRARSGDDAERRAVRESFASSILWAADVAAEDDDGRAVVDFTSFVVRDAHGVVRTLEQTRQGKFTLDAQRSIIDATACHVFPDNLELEALLTFASAAPGRHVRNTAPAAHSVTIVQHHSLIRLPDDGYRPRPFDPRAPSFDVAFRDYAAPLSAPLDIKWIARHRLEKADPQAAQAPAVEPIIYYVDRGTPEPVRSALIEGAGWWNEAFEAAGFTDAFRVDVLPPDAHPLDVRYNVIQWVHRSTRGWSYGGTVTDPRTGEIIKGHVSLGSLRVRQDRLLFEGLLGTTATGHGTMNDPIELALARIRQLAAHEVGHTLGFTHNFAASTYGGRASVMDYPAPLIRITPDDRLDFSTAYAAGIGVWDEFAVKYAYSVFPEGVDEHEALVGLIDDTVARDMLFITDADARPPGAAHPQASLWDNGTDAVAELQHAMNVRRIGIATFADDRIAEGRPRSLLHEVFVPVYLHHRYQLDAAVKVVGGFTYSYTVRGDSQRAPHPLDGAWQRQALATILQVVTPAELDIPDHVVQLMSPRPFGYSAHREMFDTATSPAFDVVGVARTMADMAIQGVLQHERCARLVAFHASDESLPSFEEVLTRLADEILFKDRVVIGRRQEIAWAVQDLLVARMIQLELNPRATSGVRMRVAAALIAIRDRLVAAAPQDAAVVHRDHLVRTITRHLDRLQESVTPPTLAEPAPPGSPIGMSSCSCSY